MGGTNPYLVEGEAPEYPPHAIVLLSPLGATPASWIVPAWTFFNLGLAFSASYLALRAVRPGITLPVAALPILLFLCWGGFRTLLQFSLLSLTLGLCSMVLAEKRPLWSGLVLGLALLKPQMAVPFALWMLFTRRLRVAGWAVVTVLVGSAVFCVRVQADPLHLVVRYMDILRRFYLGDAILVGLSQLRPLIALAVSSTARVDALAITIALMVLGGVCIVGFREGRHGRLLRLGAPPLASVWSLLTFYHLTYGFILLLPTAALLLFAGDPRTREFRRSVFWLLQFFLMFDVPGTWRRLGPVFDAPANVNAVVGHADRVLMIVLCACLFALAARTRASDIVRVSDLPGPSP